MDESGEIRCTGFKEQCEKFYKMLEVGKVYLISNCTLKPANKQYSKLDNDYEMTMKESTEVVLCTDDDAAEVPSIVFNFVKISDLSADLKESVVDLIGICKTASDVQTITSQKLNKVKFLRLQVLKQRFQTRCPRSNVASLNIKILHFFKNSSQFAYFF